MSIKTVEAATVLPVTLAEVKEHLRLSSSYNGEDTLLLTLVAAAWAQAELLTGRGMVEATYELALDDFPAGSGVIELPYPPLQSVTSVKYIDTDGTEQTLSTDSYVVDTESLVGRVYLAYGESWPSTQDRPQSVRVRFVGGYEVDDSGSPDVSTTPDAIKAWMLLKVATLYESRETVVVGQSVASMPRDFTDALLDRYRIPLVA